MNVCVHLMTALKRLWRASSGASTIEFAFVAPILLVFVFGVFDFGRLLWIQNLLQFAVEETARQSLRSTPAIVNCPTTPSAADSVAAKAIVVVNLVGLPTAPATVTAASVDIGNTTVTPTPKLCKLTITYPFSFFGLLDLSAVTPEGVASFPCSTGTTC